MKDGGQIVIIMLLIMLVALTIALAIAQRSLTHISTSNKSEQSTRAFNAAEAGLEQAVNKGSSTGSLSLSNQSAAKIATSNLIPIDSTAIEYPAIGKDTVAQFWLIDPYKDANFTSAPTAYYPSNTPFYVYFSTITSYLQSTTAPAIEVNFIEYDTSSGYLSFKGYYDADGSRITSNHFTQIQAPDGVCNSSQGLSSITTTEGPNRIFVCKMKINPASLDSNAPNRIPVMVRVRLLYTNIFQPVALQPDAGAVKFFPPQITIFTSAGSSGQTERKLRVFQAPFIAPSFFDYAIFSTTNLNK